MVYRFILVIKNMEVEMMVKSCQLSDAEAVCATAAQDNSFKTLSHCNGPPSPPPPLPIDSNTPSLPSYLASSLISVCPLPFVFSLVSLDAFVARDEDADSISTDLLIEASSCGCGWNQSHCSLQQTCPWRAAALPPCPMKAAGR